MSQHLLSARARQLVDETAQRYGFEFADLIAPHRGADVVEARHVAMYVLRIGLQLSYPRVGQIFKRDHTTAIAGIKKVEAKPHLKALADQIIGREFPIEGRTVGMVTDQGLRQYLAELDAKMEQGRTLRQVLTGRESLEVAR